MMSLPAAALSLALPSLPPDPPPPPRPSVPDYTEEIRDHRSYAIPAAQIVVFDTLLNLWDRHHFGCCDFDSNIHTIRANLRSSWVVDRDPFLVNQLGHP